MRLPEVRPEGPDRFCRAAVTACTDNELGIAFRRFKTPARGPDASAMELFATPDNPIPAQGQALSVRTADGVVLRAARWRPTTRKVKGTVVVVQGRAEFIEKYFETIGDLRRRGFHVVAFDFRGQGASQRLTGNPRKGHVRRFAHYLRDLDAIIADVLSGLPQPWFALGHSMGAAVLLTAAHRGGLPFRRMMLTAPLIDIRATEGRTWPFIVAGTLKALGMGSSFIPGGGETSLMTKPFAGNRLSRDPVRYARNADLAARFPHLAIGEPTVSWLWTVLWALKAFRAPRYPLEITVPTLIMAAGDDEIVSTRATERFASRLKGGYALIAPGARHEILNELDVVRQEFWAAFDAFVPGTERPAAPDAGEPDQPASSAIAAS